MKKKLSIFMLALVIIATAISTNAGCPQGNGGPCSGVCVAVYNSGGTVGSYVCSTGSTGAEKDCTTSSIQAEFSAE